MSEISARRPATRLAERLAALSAREMVSAAGLGGAPWWLRGGLELPLRLLSAPIGRVLSSFDAAIAAQGLPQAAEGALAAFGATSHVSGSVAGRGPLLVIANHPGAYDALALMAALRRADLLVLADGRDFLGALPNFSRDHVVLLQEGELGRVGGLRRLLRHLNGGGAVLHFAAGSIEPDPAFPSHAPLLSDWPAGTGRLARAAYRGGGQVSLAAVSGVHNSRARAAWPTRLAEARGITTFAPLLQLTVPAYRRVSVEISLTDAPPTPSTSGTPADGGGVDDETLTATLRSALLSSLAGRRRG